MDQEIIRTFLRLRSPFKVANHLGLPIEQVFEALDRHPEVRKPKPSANYVEIFGGMGRPELAEFIVARKRPCDIWDNGSPPIAAARAAYEAGTHDLQTARDGEWLILYSTPQKVVTPRLLYFSVTHAL